MKGDDFMDNLKSIFGTRIGNALLRNEIHNIEELKKYCVDHPYHSNTKAYIWRHIGERSYKIIDNYLKEL